MQATVETWMSPAPVTVGPEDPALVALDRMLDQGVRHLPVVGADGRLLGVVSLDDLRAALPFAVSLRRPPSPGEREASGDWQVGEIMTHAPLAVGPATTLAEAAERMAEARIGCLPVLDEKGRLVGILSETDLLRALTGVLRHGESVRGPAHEDEVGRFVEELERERDRIVRTLARQRELEQELTADPHEQPTDLVELASDEHAVALTERLDALAARRLDAIQEALRRAALGHLGACERCGGRIPIGRLRALPGATLCVACARAGAS
jgi:CBS domain-containing protein/RNA polymerase-binding transcription factor DksA